MNDKCVGCGENEIKYIKRGLCGPCYVSAYRNNELHFYPIDLKRWATRKYSPALLEDFENLVANDGITLEDVGKKHGFTRENVRQLFLHIYGFHYTVIKQTRIAKRHERLRERQLLKRDPRNKVAIYKPSGNIYIGAEAEKKVLEICIALGYEVKPYLPGKQIDLVINGYNVEVKSAYRTGTTSPGQKTPSYHFSLSESQSIAEFVICYAAPMNNFFVIPRSEFPTGNHLYLPEKSKREWDVKYSHFSVESKYYKYLEAWHLLKTKEAVIFSRSLQPALAEAI